MGKNKKHIKLILVLISLFIPVVIFAYRPGYNEACEKTQFFLVNAIIDYFEFEDKKITEFLPGSECDKLCKEINFTFDKWRISQNCTYGLTLIKGEPKLYCYYHGNSENIRNFLKLNDIRRKPTKIPSGFINLFICLIGGAVIYSIRKKQSKKSN